MMRRGIRIIQIWRSLVRLALIIGTEQAGLHLIPDEKKMSQFMCQTHFDAGWFASPIRGAMA
jgi:hypothetical protein